MKSLFLLMLVMASNSVCSQIRSSKPDLINAPEPFSESGRIEEVSSTFTRAAEIEKVESGEIAGVKYRFFYSDGSGRFVGTKGNSGTHTDSLRTNWDVVCKKDPVNDKKYCSMQTRDLWIFVYPRNVVKVSVGNEHYPGSTVAIRIDKGKPTSASTVNDGDFDRATSQRVVQQLSKASEVTTRFMKWPYRSWEDETWEIYGFNETLAYLHWALKHMQ